MSPLDADLVADESRNPSALRKPYPGIEQRRVREDLGRNRRGVASRENVPKSN